MPNRIKPKGQDLIDWCQKWDTADHDKKVLLATNSGVTYGTAKHWRSESTDIPTLVGNGRTKRPMRIDTSELLTMKPSTHLDFVSFDIETSNLQADFSVLLSAVIKPYGQEPVVFRSDTYDSWANNRANDGDIVKDISSELQKHAIVITHYGDRFDIPFLRAKMVHHGLPPLPHMFGVDSWKIARNNFKVSSRRLKNLAHYFDIGEKEGVEGSLWMNASYNGSKEAMDEIVAHNIIDCEVLEKLASISFPYLKSIQKL